MAGNPYFGMGSPFDEYGQSFFGNDKKTGSFGGEQQFFSNADPIISDARKTKVSSSPIGGRSDSMFGARSLSPYIHEPPPQPQRDSFSSTPPSHMNNLFGPSLNPLPVFASKSVPNDELGFSLRSLHNEIEDVVIPRSYGYESKTKGVSSAVELASSILDDDEDPGFGFEEDTVTNGSMGSRAPTDVSGSPGTDFMTDPDLLAHNPDLFSTTFGEHPLGEHPSRTLFVRNINSNVEDEELLNLFEQYGPIRNMYTQCKHRGFVMISYYDIRHAKNAMRYLQGKVLRRRKLDIHYSIPKDNPSEKDQNQGTLVVFNLDPSTDNEELKNIFGAYGEIKEIRETPNKKHHKFIEFYDTRDAEKAMKCLNKTEVKGKKIKIEPSRPGGARKNAVLSTPGTPATGSPSASSLSTSPHQQQYDHISGLGASPQLGGTAHFPMNLGTSPSSSSFYSDTDPDPLISHSLPYLPSDNDSFLNGGLNSYPPPPTTMPRYNPVTGAMETMSPPNATQGFMSRAPPRPRSRSVTSYNNNPTTSTGLTGTSLGNGPSLNGLNSLNHSHSPIVPPITLNPVTRSSSSSSLPSAWMNPVEMSSSPRSNVPAASNGVIGGGGGDPRLNRTLSPTPFNNPFGLSPSDSHGLLHLPIGTPNGISPQASPRDLTREGDGSNSNNATPRRHRSYSTEEDKSKFILVIDRVKGRVDLRTTLMIKNIPNKYSQKMLLSSIDERHKGSYDFFYLPIDFKNKCNVGYAFINFISTEYIVAFYEEFNNKKWEKFNSEKVCEITYARIQGKNSLINHFQNSSLMCEDKKCRPIIFHSDGPNLGEQEPFPVGLSPRRPRSISREGREEELR